MVPAPLSVPPVTYFALDLDGNELRRALNEVHNSDIGPSLSGKVGTKGLWGTYENGFEFIASGGLGSPDEGNGPTPVSQATSGADATPTTFLGQPPIYYLFLGGNIGSFYRGDDSQFLRAIPLRPGDKILLAVGHIHERSNLHTAYNDPNGYSKAFAMNGLNVVGNVVGSPGLFNHNDWMFVYILNEEKCRYKLIVIKDPEHLPSLSQVALKVSTSASERMRSMFLHTIKPFRSWKGSLSGYQYLPT